MAFAGTPEVFMHISFVMDGTAADGQGHILDSPMHATKKCKWQKGKTRFVRSFP
jgi:hypothetical protein